MWSVEGSTLEPYWVSRESVPTHKREKGISPSPWSGCEVWFREWGADTIFVYLACNANDNEKPALVPAGEEGEWLGPIKRQRNFISVISTSVLTWWQSTRLVGPKPSVQISAHTCEYTHTRTHACTQGHTRKLSLKFSSVLGWFPYTLWPEKQVWRTWKEQVDSQAFPTEDVHLTSLRIHSAWFPAGSLFYFLHMDK